jgi:predicted NBD/HSP70 family sugar kinase
MTATLNDAEAALVEEAASLDESTTAAMVMVGTGIGAAFLVGGRMLRGASGWAGELGSIPFRINEGYTTLDAAASGDAIVKRIGAEFEVVAARAHRGDQGVLQVFSECGAALGAGLASVINLFNPSLLALGGGTLRWPGYLSAAVESAHALSIPQLWNSCTVRESVHGERLVALGAARAAAELKGHNE